MDLNREFWLVVGGSGFAGMLACIVCETVCRAQARQSCNLRSTAKLPMATERQARDRAVRPTAILGIAWGCAAFMYYGPTVIAGAALLAFVFCAVTRSEMQDTRQS